MLRMTLCTVLVLNTWMSIWGQQLKTYNGNYAAGTATYSYYQDGANRVFDGRFSYRSDDKSHHMGGNFKDGFRDGLWKSEYLGFREEINYDRGRKDGKYSLSYNRDNCKIDMTAYLNDNDIDSLIFSMISPYHGKIWGKENRETATWNYKEDVNVYSTQYFHKNIYIGRTYFDETTGSWVYKHREENTYATLDSIQKVMGIMDLVMSNDFRVGDEFYKPVGVKNQFSQSVNTVGDIFWNIPLVLREIPYYFIYDFHRFNDYSLRIGEVLPQSYDVYYKIEKDYVRTQAEIDRKLREKQRQDSIAEVMYEKVIQEKEEEFSLTEYGKLINYLRESGTQYYKIAAVNYINEKIAQYRLAVPPVKLSKELINDRDSIDIEFTYTYGPNKYVPQSVRAFVNDKLKDYYLFAMPTSLVLKDNQWKIADMVLVYYRKVDDMEDMLNEMYKDIVVKDGYAIICNNELKITSELKYKGETIDLLQLSKVDKIKRKGVYIERIKLIDTSGFLDKLTYEEVNMTIERRFNIKKKSYDELFPDYKDGINI